MRTTPTMRAHAHLGRASTGSLHLALEAAMSKYFGRPRWIKRLRRRISDYSTSFKLEELDLWMDGGERLELFFKDLSWRALLPEAREVRPRFLYHPRREIEVYRSLLQGSGLGTAACYGAVVDQEADCYWLFLERVPSAKLCHVGEFSAWTDAARWLARLHARFAEPDADALSDPLTCYDEAFYQLWLDRLETLSADGVIPSTRRLELRRLMVRYAQTAARLAELPVTLIHGEFYPHNILIADDGRNPSVCPVDWELAAVGPGLIDLAALCAGEWTPAQREQIVLAYREALGNTATAAATLPADWWNTLGWCQLHVAVQWACWAADWDAPHDQARDWLDEAMRIAADLVV